MEKKLIAPHLDGLLGVVAATIDTSGRLVEANRGFWRIAEEAGLSGESVNVAHLFAQPRFSALLAAPADSEGTAHQGLLTFGAPNRRSRSLKGRVWRQDDLLCILAECDIEDLERICATTLELNRNYSNMQLELAQKNFKLKQNEAQLQKLVDELTTAIRERELAQNQLMQAEKMASIGFLAAGVAHEINNPIGFVKTNLNIVFEYLHSLLRFVDAYKLAVETGEAIPAEFEQVTQLQDELDLDFIKEDVGTLFNESRSGLERVKRIVQALKDFSGVDAAGGWRVYDLKVAVDNTLSLLEHKMSHCDVRNELGELPHVECVYAELNQVFMNLLLNAAQAIEGYGVVSIRGGSDDDKVWIEIADTGKGIPPENLPHIFDPFFTTHQVGKGAGLGLSVTHGIIHKHNGQIEVSGEPGQGTRFRIHLPLRQARH